MSKEKLVQVELSVEDVDEIATAVRQRSQNLITYAYWVRTSTLPAKQAVVEEINKDVKKLTRIWCYLVDTARKAKEC